MSFRQFPQILGGVGQKEFVFCSVWAALAQSIEPEDAFQMSEEHPDLLSLPARDHVGLGLCDCARLVASGFMNGARDLACRRVRAALLSEGYRLPKAPSEYFLRAVGT
jgi:hypothetical protein